MILELEGEKCVERVYMYSGLEEVRKGDIKFSERGEDFMYGAAQLQNYNGVFYEVHAFLKMPQVNTQNKTLQIYGRKCFIKKPHYLL